MDAQPKNGHAAVEGRSPSPFSPSPSASVPASPLGPAQSAGTSIKSDAQSLPPPPLPGKAKAQRVETEPPSFSAQTKTADGADRKRIYRACETCRRKKIKCNGTKPCKPCVKMSETCIFLDDTSKSSTYSKSYVESLEKRLKKLEEDSRVKNGDEGDNSPASDAHPSLAASTSASRSSNSAGPSSYFPHPKPGVLQMSLVAMGNDESCAGRLQTDEEGNRRYIGPSAALGILCDAASLALGPSANTGLERSILPPSAELRILSGGTGVSLASVVPTYPSVDGVSLPPRDLADALLRTFFESIHPIFPVLNERETKHKCALIYESMENPPQAHFGSSGAASSAFSSGHQDKGSGRNDPLIMGTIFAVFACASRILKDPRVCTAFPSAAEAENEGYADVYQHQIDTTSPSQGEQPPPLSGPNFALAGLGFFERAQVLSLHRASDTRLEQVQCTALLALYMSACNCAARAWILCGTALRVAIDIGIHRAIIPLEMSVAELEMRRRVWACVYTIDRLLGIALGRPLGIEDINHDQMRPSLSLESGSQKLMPGFNLLVDLLQMQALLCRCVTRLNNARSQSDLDTVSSLRAQALGFEDQLAEWMARMPPHLRNPTSEPGSVWDIQSVVLMATYHSAEMLLYRSLVQDSQKKPTNTLSREDDEVLTKATRTAVRIIKLAPQMSVLAATHFTLEFSQQLLVAASFLGLNAYRHRGANALKLFSQADEGVLGLRLLEPNFPGARNLRKALSRVIKALRQKCGVAPPPGPAPGMSSPKTAHSAPRQPHAAARTLSDPNAGAGPSRTASSKHRAQPYPTSSSSSSTAAAASSAARSGADMGISRLVSPSLSHAQQHGTSSPGSTVHSPETGQMRAPGSGSSGGGGGAGQGLTPPDLPGLSFSIFSGSEPYHFQHRQSHQDEHRHHHASQLQPHPHGTTPAHGHPASAPTSALPLPHPPSAMPPSSSSSAVAAAAAAAPAPALPDYFDGATMSTDFHFDGGFDPFAALELLTTCDLSALIGHDTNGAAASLGFGPSSSGSS
ncbi:hypothetical protein OC834_004214 [Tilletia horrida]|nr:hypothetical protein OC834_004214 [Tilletia horrida]